MYFSFRLHKTNHTLWKKWRWSNVSALQFAPEWYCQISFPRLLFKLNFSNYFSRDDIHEGKNKYIEGWATVGAVSLFRLYIEACMFAAGRLTQAEDRAEGAVTFQTYKTYMKSGGGK